MEDVIKMKERYGRKKTDHTPALPDQLETPAVKVKRLQVIPFLS